MAAGMCIMTSVAAMHEDVQKRTSQERKPNQDTEHMPTVLCEKKRPGNGEKADKSKPGPRGQKAGLLRSSMARVILMGHMSPAL